MKKERWVVSAKRADFQAIADRFGIDPVIARLIRNRDVTGEKEIEEYLFGDLEQLHDPLLMKDMERAADLIAEKIRGEKADPHHRGLRHRRCYGNVYSADRIKRSRCRCGCAYPGPDCRRIRLK